MAAIFIILIVLFLSYGLYKFINIYNTLLIKDTYDSSEREIIQIYFPTFGLKEFYIDKILLERYGKDNLITLLKLLDPLFVKLFGEYAIYNGSSLEEVHTFFNSLKANHGKLITNYLYTEVDKILEHVDYSSELQFISLEAEEKFIKNLLLELIAAEVSKNVYEKAIYSPEYFFRFNASLIIKEEGLSLDLTEVEWNKLILLYKINFNTLFFFNDVESKTFLLEKYRLLKVI